MNELAAYNFMLAVGQAITFSSFTFFIYFFQGERDYYFRLLSQLQDGKPSFQYPLKLLLQPKGVI